MASDPGGGTPPGLFGTRYGPLGNIGNEWTIQKKTKTQKRTAARETEKELEFMKQLRVDGRNNAGRYLIVSRTTPGKTMDDLNPFFIKKSIDTISSNIKIERYKEGTLLLKTVDKQQADKMLKQTILGTDIGIEVVDHPTMNICKGTIFCPDLKKMSDDAILNEMRESHVVEVKRMQMRNREGKFVDSGSFILSFNLTYLPDTIDAGFYKCKVRHFIPNPIRCMNCLSYGHKKDKCRGNQICAKCAGLFHDNLPCLTKVTCVNCRGDHSALSKLCPVYMDEFEIQRIRVEERISLKEAKQKRRLRVPDARQTLPTLKGYATALKGKENGTETPTKGTQQSKPTTVSENHQRQRQEDSQPVIQQQNPQESNSNQHMEKQIRREDEPQRDRRTLQEMERRQQHNEPCCHQKNQHIENSQQISITTLGDERSSLWVDIMDKEDETNISRANETEFSTKISINNRNKTLSSVDKDESNDSNVISEALKASMFGQSNL